MTSPYLIIPYKVYAFIGKIVTNFCGCTILSCAIKCYKEMIRTNKEKVSETN